jgi:hypothetical protein
VVWSGLVHLDSKCPPRVDHRVPEEVELGKQIRFQVDLPLDVRGLI